MAEQHECQDEIKILSLSLSSSPPPLTSRFSSVPSLDVASSSQPTVTSMLRRFLPWTTFLWFVWNSWFCQTAVLPKSVLMIHMIQHFWQRKNLIGQRKKRRGQGQRMSHLRVAQTWPSWSPLRLNCCNTRSCYSRFGKSSNLEKSSACLIFALLIMMVWSA